MGHYDPGGWQRENPFTSGKNEMSFFAKLILTIVVLSAGVLVYRYQSEILHSIYKGLLYKELLLRLQVS